MGCRPFRALKFQYLSVVRKVFQQLLDIIDVNLFNKSATLERVQGRDATASLTPGSVAKAEITETDFERRKREKEEAKAKRKKRVKYCTPPVGSTVYCKFHNFHKLLCLSLTLP